MALMGVALMGVALMGVALMGVALMGVALMGVALMGVALRGLTLRGVALVGVARVHGGLYSAVLSLHLLRPVDPPLRPDLLSLPLQPRPEGQLVVLPLLLLCLLLPLLCLGGGGEKVEGKGRRIEKVGRGGERERRREVDRRRGGERRGGERWGEGWRREEEVKGGESEFDGRFKVDATTGMYHFFRLALC